ncbi:MAG: hypothetical protein ACK5AJ_06685 [bacterium]
MNRDISPKNWPKLNRIAIACVMLLACSAVLADTAGDDSTPAFNRADTEKTAAPVPARDKERMRLPESAFVQTDPHAPLPKLSAPMRPTARAIEADVTIIPQTKSRVRSASESPGKTSISQSVNAPQQVTEIKRVDLRRPEKPVENSNDTAIENTVSGYVPSQPKLSSAASTPAKQPDTSASVKPNPQPTHPSVTTRTNSVSSFKKTRATDASPTIERRNRQQPDVTTQTQAEGSMISKSSTQNEEDLLAAKLSLAESTARLRVIEKTIQDIQQMLPAPTLAHTGPLLLAALPYTSVTVQSNSGSPPYAQSTGTGTDTENTLRAGSKIPAVGQWGLLQLILVSIAAGIVGYALLHRNRLASEKQM